MLLCVLELDTYVKLQSKTYMVVAKYSYDPGFEVGNELTILMPKTDENLYPVGRETEELKVIVTKIKKVIYPSDRKDLIKELIKNLHLEEVIPIERAIKTGIFVKKVYLEAEDRDYMLKESEKIRKENDIKG